MRAKWGIGLLGCVLTLGICCAGAEAGSLLEDDFDGYASGSPPVPPWGERYAGPGSVPEYTRAEAAALGVTIQIDDAVALSGKSVRFLDTSSSVGSRLYHDLAPSSSVVVEYYMRTHNGSYEGVFVGLVGDVDDPGYCVCFGDNGYIGVVDFWHGGWPEPQLLAYELDTWYGVRRVFNCATSTGRFDVWEVDDPSNSAFYEVTSEAPQTYIDQIRLFTSVSQGADCNIDELLVTPEPATLSLLAVGACLALRRRKRA